MKAALKVTCYILGGIVISVGVAQINEGLGMIILGLFVLGLPAWCVKEEKKDEE